MIFLMAYAPEVPKPAGRDMGTSAALNLALRAQRAPFFLPLPGMLSGATEDGLPFPR
jgi:hypothetical protein